METKSTTALEVITPGSTWRFHQKALTLVHQDTGYDVDLETCRTCPELADWIFQVTNKNWVSTEDLGFLIRDLNTLLGPQGSLCSCGKEKGPIDVHKVLEHRKRYWPSRDPFTPKWNDATSKGGGGFRLISGYDFSKAYDPTIN